LCALNLENPCPTFRPAVRGEMVSPKQATLIPHHQQIREPARIALGAAY